VTVSEREIADAIGLLARTAGVTAEGAGAVPLAAVLGGKVRARSAVLLVSGRNIDARVHRDLLAGGASLPVAA
jgi:threonine dehydratase